MMRPQLQLLILPLLFCCACKESEQAAPTPTPVQQTDAPEYSGANAYAHCQAICNLGARPTGSPAYEQQLAYLTRYLQKTGWHVSRRAFSLSNGAKMTNLHAVFGESAEPRPVIVTCHIDTKQGVGRDFVGADDGASGAAALLELARYLSREPRLAAGIELVFFDGEESFGLRMTEQDGLYGSRYDVMRRGDVLPSYQINLDMVGARNKTIAIPLHDTGEEMLAHYEAVLEELKLSPRNWTAHPGSYLDDHIPFERAGVKTLNLIADFTCGGWWHTERDNMERICPQSLQETGKVVLALLRRLPI